MSSTRMEVEALDGEVVAAGGELVVAEGLALTAEGIAAAERQIIALREAADVGGLDDARVRMETWQRAAQLHEQYVEMLRPIGRLKLLIEAAIGQLDLNANGWGRTRRFPLVLPSGEISKHMRTDWRTLALAEQRGMLRPLLDTEDDFGTVGVCVKLRRAGVMWAERALVERAWRESGMPVAQLAKAIGISGLGHAHVFGRSETGAIGFARASRIAAALGRADDEFPPFMVSFSKRGEAVTRRSRAMRALAEKEREQAIKRAVRKQGAAIAELYTMAERMQDVMGQAHREATDSQAREALSIAGTHYRKMRDEIVRALGVS